MTIKTPDQQIGTIIPIASDSQDILINIYGGICIFINLAMIFMMFLKKKDLWNTFTNSSYCKISDYILNMAALNSLVYSSIFVYILYQTRSLNIYCPGGSYDISTKCIASLKEYRFAYRIAFFLSIFTRLISVTQIYEWLSMRLIILWQSGKDLT